ncbi:MAG TPA: YtxH domain-containing protein [Methylomirabilota bacterium]|nr:YtxH domain-containing protein [Methylomirabilota bacterium]
MFYKNRKKDTIKKLAIGSTIAAVAGYLAGVLTAPQSGKETRKDIKKAADKSLAEAEKDFKRLQVEIDKAVQQGKVVADKANAKAQKELTVLLEKAKDSKEKAREVISAVRAGDAEDKDLKKAVKDANTALDHLKDYLKK